MRNIAILGAMAFASFFLSNTSNADSITDTCYKSFDESELKADEKACKLAADAGDAKAMYILGYVGCNDDNVSEADWEKCHEYTKKSADLGYPQAAISMAYSLIEGENPDNPQETNKSLGKYLRIAADSGMSDAQYELGGLLFQNGNREEAFNYYRKAVSQNNINATIALGIALTQIGSNSDECNEGISYLEKVLKEIPNNIVTLEQLYSLYHDGICVKEDHAKAAEYIFKLDDLEGAYRQGLLYVSGDGVAKDIEKGRQLLCEAASYGDFEEPIMALKKFGLKCK